MYHTKLKDLSLEELKELRVEIAQAITAQERHCKQEALEQLQAKARQLGFNLEELAPAMQRGQVGAMLRYANPANPGEVWRGRGRKPRWFTQAMAAGKSPEELQI
ncbi:H-NS histone family protein [Rhodobacter sphaeroides]|jgi:DNA-binding protein H-NS|uniref:DNA-binding protein, H-NS family n=1 Tax=Cereibacter sphaeroides (strain ATCC 17023 / DSM 158 / JCM 6121 / CCUG 31486 / LMG 2827 / NBRC 12203 / NCIMB 8253 / ATH 2.4.1.) TaxID=272943 RepID=Q3IVA4_CERS4|nr:H-NS histone family protein [Cereibacter sphaeroides]ABA81530.1 DNA-binding protein, H-NS family [Cereibacter sphaeroides 2.4.1]AMJ50158.1 transcriptional regulator [Cereibacter sphaeroides]ANS36697.1 transcriptional regulator [Cereibacter sphaeroides]ATN65881.1 transcriptional regulator [Cereibacter sphaeroides]AXC64046.1 H-NS histone family protein [Cereibacter sphaeroides 2.4.1]